MHKIQNSGNIFTTDATPISMRSAIQVAGLVPHVCCTYTCKRCRVLYRLALPLTPIMTTHDSTPVIDEETTQRSIIGVGCQFTEYRGQGKPTMGQLPAKPGDVYFDVKEQLYTVWVCQSDYGWSQWVSMADSKKCQHPEQEQILYPLVQRLVWVPISGYDAYLHQTTLRLGKCKDSADMHIKIILDQERGLKPVPPPIKEASPEQRCCFSQCRGFSVEDIGMVRPSMFHSVYWHGTSTMVYICLNNPFTYNILMFKMPWSEQRTFHKRNTRILSSSWT